MMTRTGWKILVIVAKILVTVGILAFIATRQDFHSIAWKLVGTTPVSAICALSLAVLQIVIVGVRWCTLARAITPRGGHLPSRLTFQGMNYASQFVGQVMPLLASDAIRVVYARSSGMLLRDAFVSTAFDRAFALVALLALSLVGLAIGPWANEIPNLRRVVVYFAGFTALATWLVAMFGIPTVERILPSSLAKPAITVIQAFRQIGSNGSVVTQVIVLCVVVHGMSVMIFWLLAAGQGIDMSLYQAAALVPLIILGTVIPIGVGGWGVREGATVIVLGTIGVPSDSAFVLSLSFGAVGLLAALLGAAALLLGYHDSSEAVRPDRKPN